MTMRVSGKNGSPITEWSHVGFFTVYHPSGPARISISPYIDWYNNISCHQYQHPSVRFVSADVMWNRHVVRERPVKTKRRMAELMWSWACTELGFRLIGIIRRMCSFGTYVRLIRGSLIVENFSCAWLGRLLPPTPLVQDPQACAASKHGPFDSINTRSIKIGVNLSLLASERYRATTKGPFND